MSPAVVEILLRELAQGRGQTVGLVLRDVARSMVPVRPTTDLSKHLRATIEWIKRAQDATQSGGVAHGYLVACRPASRTRGWLAAYPETTGYIIPTVFDYAAAFGDADACRRAVAMADWELEVQMPSGAVRGGTVDQPATPAVFNTGQVIFGWVRAARETADERYLRAAERAGRFLVEHQDADGVWRRGLSQYAKAGPQTYNTRTAWALLELADATGDHAFREAGIRNVEAALARQLPNGWFGGNCLDNDEAPLTHTIAYAIRGILEAGHLLGSERYLVAARRAADAVRNKQRQDGSLAGRYDREWRPAVRWSCLTGNAQMAIIWLRLADVFDDGGYVGAAERSLQFLAGVQNLRARDGGVRGGVAGSFPIFGEYGRFEYLNWAAKFFIDGAMALQECQRASRPVAETKPGLTTNAAAAVGA